MQYAAFRVVGGGHGYLAGTGGLRALCRRLPQWPVRWRCTSADVHPQTLTLDGASRRRFPGLPTHARSWHRPAVATLVSHLDRRSILILIVALRIERCMGPCAPIVANRASWREQP